jgi:formylglycine-generating enzyme required for sulfatase activity
MVDIDQYYTILELMPGASADEIRQAYRDLVKVWHPDRFSRGTRLQKKAEERTRLINEAYEVLRSYIELGPAKPKKKKTGKESQRTSKSSTRASRSPERIFKNSVGIKFAVISPGVFMMGSPEGIGEDDEHPLHKVRITRAFHMGITPVTQAQWKAVMGSNPSSFKGDDLPVECISWNDAKRFVQSLSRKEDIFYRLPTEAEWEYACKGKSLTRYYFGSDEAELPMHAWFLDNSEMQTHPVGLKTPNSLGLYDMHGNVWEWCEDWYDEKYYKSSPTNKPRGPAMGKHRVVRGGSWSLSAPMLRSGYRIGNKPNSVSRLIGFRCVKD